MQLAKRLLVTFLVITLTIYGLASIWCTVPLAESISWLWCSLLYLRDGVLSFVTTVAAGVVVLLVWCKWGRKSFPEGSKNIKLYLSKTPKNPYPKCSCKTIASFKYESDLHLIRFREGLKGVARKDQYVVAAPYKVSFKLGAKKHCIKVPKGMLTDLSSAPFPLNCIVGRVGPHLEATIVHDYLYVAWQDHGDHMKTYKNRKFADRLILEGMKASGMTCMAYAIYCGIRLGGTRAFCEPNPIRYVDLGECSELHACKNQERGSSEETVSCNGCDCCSKCESCEDCDSCEQCDQSGSPETPSEQPAS